jgi:hypothetical protein
VDPRADIWAIGLVLHEMLTGHMPPAGSVDPLPPPLERIVRKCLNESPSKRYQNAADLAADLRSLTAARRVSRIPAVIVSFMANIGIEAIIAFAEEVKFHDDLNRFRATKDRLATAGVNTIETIEGEKGIEKALGGKGRRLAVRSGGCGNCSVQTFRAGRASTLEEAPPAKFAGTDRSRHTTTDSPFMRRQNSYSPRLKQA